MATATDTGSAPAPPNHWPLIARQAAARYLALQGLAGAAWWGMLWLWPQSRDWFFAPAFGQTHIVALALPDITLFAAGSMVAAMALHRGWRWGLVATAIVAGATAYATLFCFGTSLATGEAWLATVLMSAASFITAICVWFAWPDIDLDWLFRASPPRPGRRDVIHTLAQTAAFWLTFLLLVPAGLVTLENHAGIPGWQPGLGSGTIAVLLFVAGGTLGIASGITMARAGRGTPLPTACPAQLVVAGPYRFVRNPMAVGGLAQGAAVGLLLGSPLVLAYVLAGALVWQVMVRPLEEHDLARRFGDAYEDYRRAVRCWVPYSNRSGRAGSAAGA